MMTEDELSELGNATGAMFDRMWTQMMIKHHQGAVTMAKTEQAVGKNPTRSLWPRRSRPTRTARSPPCSACSDGSPSADPRDPHDGRRHAT